MVLIGMNIAPLLQRVKPTVKSRIKAQAFEKKSVFKAARKPILAIFTLIPALIPSIATAQMPPPPSAPQAAKALVSASVSMSGSCASCDLSNRAMPKISLKGSNLSGSNFSRSNLSGGQFIRSNLTGANFRKAYLMRVEGSHTNLHHAILRDASLIEASLLDSNISQADLRHADLTNGNFSHSRFDQSDMSGVDAVKANFTDCNFSKTEMKRADFTNADFTQAQFHKTNFGNANITNANFNGAQFLGADLSQTKGLSISQLIQACGDRHTVFPNSIDKNFRLSACPPPKPVERIAPLVHRSAQIEHIAPLMVLEQARVEAATQNPQYQAAAPRIARTFAKSYSAVEAAIPDSPMDQAIAEIEAALRDLPLGSPLHKRLVKSRLLLQQVKAAHK